MRAATLLQRNLTHYWRTNLAVVSGVATAVAVLAGALLVGDSVRASLRDLFLLRLGRTDDVILASNFFREKLADDLQSHGRFAGAFRAACPLIVFEGLVAQEESGRRASGVQVYGVDDRFWKFHESPGAPPASGDREILVSAGLAQELGTKAGDSLLLRIEKPSALPMESLHGRKDDLGRTIRFSTRDVLSTSTLGEFSIRPQQGAVRAVFVPLRRLQKELAQESKVNAILVSEKASRAGGRAAEVETLLKGTVSLEDLGIRLRLLEQRRCLSVESESILIDDTLAEAARATAAALGMRASPILTYLANAIRAGRREIPYSLVTALDLETWAGAGARPYEKQPGAGRGPLAPIVLNDWAARDLGVRPGERLSLEYYVWKEEGRLVTQTAPFQLVGIVGLQGAAADPELAPGYPGITDSESLRDWNPPFPIDLQRVRPRDEEYWDRYRTTPKAFIPLAKGQELWQSRFGKLTSVRIFPNRELRPALEAYQKRLRAALDPLRMGFSVYAARMEGLEASRGATDFGEYFVYFSFFLMASSLLLAGLFFRLGVEQRLREIGVLQALGFSAGRIRALFLSEGIVLATIGTIVGLAGAVAYSALILLGLRTWWIDAVGTRLLSLHISPGGLALGGAGGILTALLCIAWTLRGLRPATPRSLLTGTRESAAQRRSQARSVLWLGVACSLLGFVLLLGASKNWVSQPVGFFGAGTLLLAAFLCYQWAWLSRSRRRLLAGTGMPGVSQLGFRNATHRPGRSILSIALIATATFILVAVDAFRRDERDAALDRKSGSGGFPLLATSLLPLPHDPNTAEGREALNLASPKVSGLDQVTFVRFRVRPGDDTSCLNLYRPRNPRILGAGSDFIKRGRFAFQDSLARTAEEKANPWLLLEAQPADGAVPAIADAGSMTYVLHLRLGEEFVLNQSADHPLRLRLVGALADSVLQGEILISETNFLRLFPDQEGYRFFLLDAPPQNIAQVTGFLEEALSDYGLDIVPTAERLAGFRRVENTYLSTFQTLGGLGLLLGTLGLAAVLLRNVLERSRELALLRAVGYRPADLAVLVIAENALLLFCGLVSGAVCALLAIAPAWFSRGGRLPTVSLGLLLLAVLVTGLAASLFAVAFVTRAPLLPLLRAE